MRDSLSCPPSAGLCSWVRAGILLLVTLVFLAVPLPATPAPPHAFQILWPEGLPVADPADRKAGVPNVRSDPSTPIPEPGVTQSAPVASTPMGLIRRVRVPAERKVVALTFDLCELTVSVSGFDRELVNALLRHNAKATFFVGGKWMRSHPERTLQLMANPAFELGNHAWTHGNFGIMSVETATRQLLWTEAEYMRLRAVLAQRLAIATAKAAFPVALTAPAGLPLMRLPYGRCRPETLALISSLGLQTIQWDVVGETRADNSGMEQAQRVAAQVRPGSIVLMHANTVPKGTASLVEALVPLLQTQGYTLVTVSELLSMGKPERSQEGYFTHPGDNLSLDQRFGVDGTGVNMHKE